jgi:hypothetical protein
LIKKSNSSFIYEQIKIKTMQTMNLLNVKKGALAAILLQLLIMTHVSLHAQVAIGSANNPLAGAILDLNSGAAGGLILSNVNITDPEKIPDDFPGITPENATAAKAGLSGAMVYNTNTTATCPGVHVWDGKHWERIVSGLPRKGGVALSITSDITGLFAGKTVDFEVTADAKTKTCTWYVNTNGAGYKYLATTIEPRFSGPFSDGNHTVKVISDNCRFLEESEVHFAAEKVSPSFGSVAGGNYVYIYGDFEYASSSDYVQDGLVAHYDGIDNTGLGDKYHSYTATVWKDVNGANDLTLYNSPLPGGGWKSNGFYFNNSTYFNVAPVPDNWPVGSAARTVEITFITPPSGMDADFDKALFMYGHFVTQQAFGIQYVTHRYFPIEGVSAPYNYVFEKSKVPDIEANSQLNTTTSIYYGGLVKDSRVFINGERAPATMENTGTGGTLNTATTEVNIGRYDAIRLLYATDFQVLSVRLYDKTLNDDEVQKNAEVDRHRFIAPPTVTIGDNPCSEVVVLSSNFLMCKVPPGSEGQKDVVISGVPYSKAYEYVNPSTFHISGISPIIGPSGATVTLTGNRLGDITGIKVDNIDCQISNNDGNVCTFILPAHSTGEVDIIIITASKMYRLAKVFEYN